MKDTDSYNAKHGNYSYSVCRYIIFIQNVIPYAAVADQAEKA